jgi:hypothetical protein
MRSWKLAATAVAVVALAGAGIAYATIPSGGGVYSGCMLKGVGTVRLIDPSLPASNFMSHCSSLEQPMTWSQQGPQGSPGAPGAPGAPGQDGKSVVMGDAGANCANGGVSLTVGADTRYVCNGADGQDGVFTGHFQSPNGQYKLDVTDSGIALLGPNGMVHLDSTGISLNSGNVLSLKSAGSGELKAGANLNVQGAATTTVNGSIVQLNGCGGSVARLGDHVQVDPSSGSGIIIQGSPTVCAGG